MGQTLDISVVCGDVRLLCVDQEKNPKSESTESAGQTVTSPSETTGWQLFVYFLLVAGLELGTPTQFLSVQLLHVYSS